MQVSTVVCIPPSLADRFRLEMLCDDNGNTNEKPSKDFQNFSPCDRYDILTVYRMFLRLPCSLHR